MTLKSSQYKSSKQITKKELIEEENTSRVEIIFGILQVFLPLICTIIAWNLGFKDRLLETNYHIQNPKNQQIESQTRRDYESYRELLVYYSTTILLMLLFPRLEEIVTK